MSDDDDDLLTNEYLSLNAQRAFVIIRGILFAVGLVLAIGYLSYVYKYRNVFPFAGRKKGLMSVYYGSCIANYIGINIGNAILMTPCDDNAVCVAHGVYAYLFCITLSLVCLSAVVRASILLFQFRLQDILDQINEFHETKKLPDKVESVDVLMSNFYLRHRKFLEPKRILRVTIIGTSVYSILIFILALIATDDNWAALFSLGRLSSGIICLFGLYCSYHLRHHVNDNFGILIELKYTASCCIAFLIIYQIQNYLAPELSSELGTSMLLQGLGFTTIIFFGMYQPLKLVDAAEGEGHVEKTSSVAQAGGSTIGKQSVFRTTGFKSDIPSDMKTFRGIVTSKTGYDAFLDFLRGEFATENLMFWKQATMLHNECKALINEVITSQRKVSIVRLHSPAALEQRRDIESPTDKSVSPSSRRSQLPTDKSVSPSSRRRSPSPSSNVPDAVTSVLAEAQDMVDLSSPSLAPTKRILRSPSSATARMHAVRSPTKTPISVTNVGVDEQPDEKWARASFGLKDLVDDVLPFATIVRNIQTQFIMSRSINEINLASVNKQNALDMINKMEIYIEANPEAETIDQHTSLSTIKPHIEYLSIIRDIYESSLNETTHLMEADSFRRFLTSQCYKKLVVKVKEANTARA